MTMMMRRRRRRRRREKNGREEGNGEDGDEKRCEKAHGVGCSFAVYHCIKNSLDGIFASFLMENESNADAGYCLY